MKTDAETGVMWPQAKEARGQQKLEETGENPPREPMEGVWLCPHLDFGFLTSSWNPMIAVPWIGHWLL